MVKGKGEPCLSAVVRYRAERRPDRPADKEDTYGGYDMHFSLYTTLCPLQNVIPMLQIGFSFFRGAFGHLPIHISLVARCRSCRRNRETAATH